TLVSLGNGTIDSQCLILDGLPWQVDGYAKVNAGVALEGQKRSKAHRGIGCGVDRDDQLAAPLHERIDTQIFDVATIGQIHRRARLVDLTEHLLGASCKIIGETGLRWA